MPRRSCLVLDEIAEQIAAGKQAERQERMRMHQRQSGSPKRQQRRLPIRFFPHGGNQQIQGRNAHRPAAQQRALGNHQVRNDVGKTQIEVGLIGRRSVIPGENLANAGEIVRKRQIKIIEKTESPVQKEQQRRDRDRLVPPAEQLLRQQHIARIVSAISSVPGTTSDRFSGTPSM